MARWKATAVVWPHSTGNGEKVDQKAAGPRDRSGDFEADDIRGALKLAEAWASGIASHPAVWQARIHSLVCEGER